MFQPSGPKFESRREEAAIRFLGSNLTAYAKSELSDHLRLVGARILGVSREDFDRAMEDWENDDTQLLRLPAADPAAVARLKTNVGVKFPGLFEFGKASDVSFQPLPPRVEEEKIQTEEPPEKEEKPAKKKPMPRTRKAVKPPKASYGIRPSPLHVPPMELPPTFGARTLPPRSFQEQAPIRPIAKPVSKYVEPGEKDRERKAPYSLVFHGLTEAKQKKLKEDEKKYVKEKREAVEKHIKNGRTWMRVPTDEALRNEFLAKEGGEIVLKLRSFIRDYSFDAGISSHLWGQVVDDHELVSVASQLLQQKKGDKPVTIGLPWLHQTPILKNDIPKLLDVLVQAGLWVSLRPVGERGKKPLATDIHGESWIHHTGTAVQPYERAPMEENDAPAFMSTGKRLVEEGGGVGGRYHRGAQDNENKPKRKQYRRGNQGWRTKNA